MHNYLLHRPVRLACCNLNIPKIGKEKNNSASSWHPCVSLPQSQNRCDTSLTHTNHPAREKLQAHPRSVLSWKHNMKRIALEKHCKLKFLSSSQRDLLLIFNALTQWKPAQFKLLQEQNKKDVSTRKTRSQGLSEWVIKTEWHQQLQQLLLHYNNSTVTGHNNAFK